MAEDLITAWTLAGGVSDAHCHLQQLAETERASFFALKKTQGIRRFLCCATGPADWDAVARVAADAEAFGAVIVPCYGVHPWFAGEEGDSDAMMEALRRRVVRDSRAWVGECGLDRTHHVPDTETHRQWQDAIFSAQWKLAADAGRPMALHAAGAGAAGCLLERILEHKRRKPGVPGGIVHGLIASPELALAYRNEGFRIGIGAGALAEKRLARVQRMLSVLKAEDVCLESDGTDLAAHQDALRALCERLLLQ
ncbi:MAG: TatD family hydrolase [Kiritimatiellia bacterium]